MSKLRIGVIGCGYMAQMAHLPALSVVKDAEITVLCDVRGDVARQLASRWNVPRWTTRVDEALDADVDAVFVLTPVQWHLNNVTVALRAGKHVFTEKPLAMSAASADQLRSLAESSGKNVTVGYMKRHELNVQTLRRRLETDDFGKLLFARTHSFIGSYWNAGINELFPVVESKEMPPRFDATDLDPGPEWLDAPRDETFHSFDNPYYGLLDTGCHSINLLRCLIGVDMTVQAARDNGVRLVDFDFNGIPGVMEFRVNFNMRRWDEVTELYFERATITVRTPPPLDLQSAAEIDVYTEDGPSLATLKLEDNRQWAFRRQAEAFVQSVKNGTTTSDLADAVKDVAVIEDIYRRINE